VEIPPAAASSHGPVPWLLVPGPVAGVERLRADREVTLTRSVDDIGLESKHISKGSVTAEQQIISTLRPVILVTRRTRSTPRVPFSESFRVPRAPGGMFQTRTPEASTHVTRAFDHYVYDTAGPHNALQYRFTKPDMIVT
jgi:hypothetical protein